MQTLRHSTPTSPSTTHSASCSNQQASTALGAQKFLQKRCGTKRKPELYVFPKISAEVAAVQAIGDLKVTFWEEIEELLASVFR